MSWIPTLSLGISMKSGTTKSLGDGIPVSVQLSTPFPTNNYVVILTPYVISNSIHIPQAWISDALTPGSFTFTTSHADGVYWVATYSNS